MIFRYIYDIPKLQGTLFNLMWIMYLLMPRNHYMTTTNDFLPMTTTHLKLHSWHILYSLLSPGKLMKKDIINSLLACIFQCSITVLQNSLKRLLLELGWKIHPAESSGDSSGEVLVLCVILQVYIWRICHHDCLGNNEKILSRKSSWLRDRQSGSTNKSPSCQSNWKFGIRNTPFLENLVECPWLHDKAHQV